MVVHAILKVIKLSIVFNHAQKLISQLLTFGNNNDTWAFCLSISNPSHQCLINKKKNCSAPKKICSLLIWTFEIT